MQEFSHKDLPAGSFGFQSVSDMLKNVPGVSLVRHRTKEMVRLATATKTDEEELPKKKN